MGSHFLHTNKYTHTRMTVLDSSKLGSCLIESLLQEQRDIRWSHYVNMNWTFGGLVKVLGLGFSYTRISITRIASCTRPWMDENIE